MQKYRAEIKIVHFIPKIEESRNSYDTCGSAFPNGTSCDKNQGLLSRYRTGTPPKRARRGTVACPGTRWLSCVPLFPLVLETNPSFDTTPHSEARAAKYAIHFVVFGRTPVADWPLRLTRPNYSHRRHFPVLCYSSYRTLSASLWPGTKIGYGRPTPQPALLFRPLLANLLLMTPARPLVLGNGWLSWCPFSAPGTHGHPRGLCRLLTNIAVSPSVNGSRNLELDLSEYINSCHVSLSIINSHARASQIIHRVARLTQILRLY